MDWRHAYHAHIDDMRAELKAARLRGAVRYRIAGQEVDPSRLSDSQIEDLAYRDAERTINETIIRHNEEVDRRRAA